MIEVNGIILVLSCQKHLNTRLKEFKLPKNNYEGWQVIYIIGDLFLDSNYKMDNNVMTIKCEDSYIHLLKKLVLALKYVYELYDIKEGVLRCGDDLIFNEVKLQSFLNTQNKFDCIGKINHPSIKPMEHVTVPIHRLKNTINDYFMVNYYLSHPEDFNNPQHNLKNIHIQDYIKRPASIGPSGVLFYISNKCCRLLIDHMENIKYNIFHYDIFSQSYPYTIEDCGVSFILNYNTIPMLHYNTIYSDVENNESIAYHTNMYK
jgi:hypothetical protein